MSTFGYRFKKLRLARNLTQEQLADEFNERYNYSFTKATISQYENDKRIPEMSAMMNFVDYFKTSLDYLLCNDNYIINEMVEKYSSSKNSEYINLEEIINMINNMIIKDKIRIDDKILDLNQKQLLRNCLEIAIELAKRNALNYE